MPSVGAGVKTDRSKLLIVEDDPGLQRQLKWCFDACEVLLAEDRASAVAAVRRHEPAVVLQDLGKDLKTAVGPMERPALKGVPYAAKKYVTYTAKGVKREQGWIYAFAEPYQIFILYMILDKEGKNDHEAFKAILDSFEYLPKK